MSIEKRLEIRKKRDVLKKGTRLSKEYRAAKDSTNAPAFCEFESEDGERMGGVSKESLREGALAFVLDPNGLLRLSSKIADPIKGEYSWKEFDYNGINKNTKEGTEAIERINEWIGFLSGQMLQDAVKNLLSKEAGVPPEKIAYDNAAANARVGILPGESTIREVAQSWIDMLLDFEVVPMTVMRPEEDGTDVASVQENVTYHERVDGEHSPRIAHQLMNIETDWFFDEPPDRWGAILEAQDPEVSIQGDLDWASKDPARSLTRAGVLAFLMGDLDGIERNIMFHPVTGRVWKIDNGLSLGVVTGKELPGITNPGDDRPWKEVAKSVPLELMIRHGLELDDEARENVKRLHAEMQSKESKHYACIKSMFRHIFLSYGDVIADNRFQEFLERLEMIAAYGKPVGLDKWDQYIPLIENGFTEVEQGVAA